MGEEQTQEKKYEPHEKLNEVSQYAIGLMEKMDAKEVHVSFTDKKDGMTYSIKVGPQMRPYFPFRPFADRIEEAEKI